MPCQPLATLFLKAVHIELDGDHNTHGLQPTADTNMKESPGNRPLVSFGGQVIE